MYLEISIIYHFNQSTFTPKVCTKKKGKIPASQFYPI